MNIVNGETPRKPRFFSCVLHVIASWNPDLETPPKKHIKVISLEFGGIFRVMFRWFVEPGPKCSYLEIINSKVPLGGGDVIVFFWRIILTWVFPKIRVPPNLPF